MSVAGRSDGLDRNRFGVASSRWKLGAAHQRFGPNNALDLWSIKKINPQSMEHLTQKPVELMRRPILNHIKRGELVYEPFLGSGTTLAAAELTGRMCCGLELDPKYGMSS